jgi:hypothetical protein
MGVTSQVTDCDRFVRETGKGVALVRNVQDIDRGPIEPFFEHLHRVRERLKHRGISFVSPGLMGDIPCSE